MQRQHPIFRIYTRNWLNEATGFTKVYLSRLATGNTPITRSFIDRVSHSLNRPPEELFNLEDIADWPGKNDQSID